MSAQQRRFAEEHDATPGMHGGAHEQSVFVYRDEGWRTCRWLVDPTGKVEDFISLRRSASERSRRFVRRAAVGATAHSADGSDFN